MNSLMLTIAAPGKSRILPVLVCACMLVVNNRCTQSPLQQAGSVTEGGNTTACVLYPDGSPAVNVLVRLRSADYLSAVPGLAKQTGIIAADAITDSTGRFKITGIDPGEYRIEITDLASRHALLLECSLDQGDSADLGTDTLQPFATVTGTIDLATQPGLKRYVQVKGLERIVAVDGSGHYAIADLPAGMLKLRIIAEDTLTLRPMILDSITTVSGDTTIIPLAGWQFSKRLYLNTTSSGANVAEDVTGFPLLVRLEAATFDFDRARDSGQDLRFSKTDGTPLPFEIEHWDASAQTAAIWVRMDTVRGNDSTQSIVMQYGNPLAASASKAAAVFGRADGWIGVWHLDAGAGGAFADATGNGLDGVGVGFPALSGRITGHIGAAQSFDGNDDHVRINAPAGGWPEGTFTVSAWIQLADVTADRYGRMLSCKREWGDTLGFDFEVNPRHMMSTSTIETYLTVWGSDTLNFARAHNLAWPQGTWHLVCAVVMDDSVQIYRDGERVNKPGKPSQSEIASVRGTTWPLFIGGYQSDMFAGAIDEVRIRRGASSGAWEKLSYENQKRGHVLVTVR